MDPSACCFPETKPVPKPRKRGKAKLFTLEDAIATGQREETDTESRDSILRMRWEDMSLTVNFSVWISFENVYMIMRGKQ